MVFVLHRMQPCQHITLEIFHRTFLRLMLHIKDWRQVARFKQHICKKEFRLLLGRSLKTEEMVRSAYEPVFARLEEVLVKVLVDNACAFRRLYENKTYGTAVDVRRTEQRPVNISLIMGDVYAMDFITFRIIGITVQRLPAEGCRRDKEIPESPCVGSHKQKATQPPHPFGMAAESLSLIFGSSFLSHLTCYEIHAAISHTSHDAQARNNTGTARHACL